MKISLRPVWIARFPAPVQEPSRRAGEEVWGAGPRETGDMTSVDSLSDTVSPRSGRRTLLFALLAAGAAGVLLPLLWWQWMNLNPRLTPPARTALAPNALDDFKAAMALFPRTEVDHLTAALASPPPGRSRAPQGFRYSPQAQAALLHRNRRVLARLRAGLKHRYEEPLPISATQLSPHYADFRHLARLLRLESEVRVREREWAGALESSLDGLQVGIEVTRGGPAIGCLVGSAIQTIGRRNAWKTLAHLPPGAARAFARRLEQLCERQTPVWQTLESEKWFCQLSLTETMRAPDWRRRLLSDYTSLGGPVQPWPKTSEEWGLFAQLHTTSKLRAYENLTGYFETCIAISRRADGWTAPFPPLPSDPVNQMMNPVVDAVRFQGARSRILNDLLLLGLALRAYHDERGRYPDRLAELTTKYLQALPRDPFAGNTGYRYRRTPTGYRLYSLGPDRTDDGGKPLLSSTFGTSKDPAARHKIEDSARGDIVAGINLQ